MDEDKFKLGDKVKIVRSSEAGVLDAIAHYNSNPTRYYLLYTAADGRAVDGWFGAAELEAA